MREAFLQSLIWLPTFFVPCAKPLPQYLHLNLPILNGVFIQNFSSGTTVQLWASLLVCLFEVRVYKCASVGDQ